MAMKQHITTIKNRAIDWIFKRIHFVARDSVQQFDVTQQIRMRRLPQQILRY